jgi:hypothetical protein
MFYENNIKAIENYKQYLYTKLQENEKQSRSNQLNGIELVETLDGDLALAIAKDETIYRLNSIYNPRHEAGIWADQFNLKNMGIVLIMFGLGNGVFVRELIKRIDENFLLFIYEPSADIFFYMIENCDMRDIIEAPNVSITVEGINDNEIKNLLSNHITWLNLKSQIICVHPLYDVIFTESSRIFNKIVYDNNNKAIVNNNTDIAISRQIINNTLTNLKQIKKCNIVTDLIGKFPRDIPAIIVSAGPSLDKNIDDLKLLQGRAVIFAVDTAVKYLFKHDILPDFIVTLDPGKSLWHLQDQRCKDIPLFCRIDSRPENIENNRKNIILYNLEGYVKTLFQILDKNTGTLNSGGSVATGAFSICETLGFRRIILVGQDLAYSDGSTHAGGVNIDVGGAGRFLEEVEDIHGNMIKTRYDWYVYIKWFEDAVELFEGDEVIDATEGGAKIKGTSILTLKEVIEKYCKRKVNTAKIIDDLKPSISREERNLVYKLLEAHTQDIDLIKEISIEGIDICEKLIAKYEKSLEETTSSSIKNNRLSEINQLIESKVIYELIDWDLTVATSEALADIYTYTEDEKQNKLSTYTKAIEIYKAINESAERIKPKLLESLQYFTESEN